jgi:hypothetical protein
VLSHKFFPNMWASRDVADRSVEHRVRDGRRRDQRSGDEEAVDVDDPEELRAAWLEVRAERRHGEVQQGQVHRIEQTGQGDDGKPDPLTTTRLG